ncbi:hypothetical protein [Chthonobacter albigriseus]|uniref:hypothetical protein n=1 Tax=Chthonobacter albigriseus TaxID=1683161 RepID=UPI0015EFB54E|nr:hypothetical protein [Chthonobacter albigriseus]
MPNHIRSSRRRVIVAADVVAAGAAVYERARILPRLLPISAVECRSEGVEAGERIVRMLARALRTERAKGRAGHWSYDLNKHLGLAQAYRAELRLLKAGRAQNEKGAAKTATPFSKSI